MYVILFVLSPSHFCVRFVVDPVLSTKQNLLVYRSLPNLTVYHFELDHDLDVAVLQTLQIYPTSISI